MFFITLRCSSDLQELLKLSNILIIILLNTSNSLNNLAKFYIDNLLKIMKLLLSSLAEFLKLSFLGRIILNQFSYLINGVISLSKSFIKFLFCLGDHFNVIFFNI